MASLVHPVVETAERPVDLGRASSETLNRTANLSAAFVYTELVPA